VLAHPPNRAEEGVPSPVAAMARAPNPTRTSRRAPASDAAPAPAAGSGKRKAPEVERPGGDGGRGGGGAAGVVAEGATAAAAAESGGSGISGGLTSKPHGGTLFLVPQELMCQWKAGVARHAPSLLCCIIHTKPSGEIVPQP